MYIIVNKTTLLNYNVESDRGLLTNLSSIMLMVRAAEKSLAALAEKQEKLVQVLRDAQDIPSEKLRQMKTELVQVILFLADRSLALQDVKDELIQAMAEEQKGNVLS